MKKDDDNNSIASINSITASCKPRERAFFTIMRQAGLTPSLIKKLRMKDLETTIQIPLKINVPSAEPKPPVFIGGEGIKYIGQYLATRTEELKPESLLFVNHQNINKEINTKDVSRAFRLAARKETKGDAKLRLFSLVKFYRINAKHYLKELRNQPYVDDETLRALYRRHALSCLEIERQIVVQRHTPKKWFNQKIESQQNQIKDMEHKVALSNAYLSSILSLIYDNKGDWETGENVKLGDNFIKLWQKTLDKQLINGEEFLNGQSSYVPPVDILEELTNTLQKILKRYKEAKKVQKPNNQ
ncbi:MAG: hypothetical protein ABSF44_15845 [Candidatus Bathyarchaeia archaeon]